MFKKAMIVLLAGALAGGAVATTAEARGGGGGGGGSGGLNCDPPGGMSTCAEAAPAKINAAATAQMMSDACFMGDMSCSPGRAANKLFFRRVFDRVEAVGLQAQQVPRLQHMRRQRR